MKILIIGSGGREHALAWKLAQSGRIQVVFVAPGNGGTAQDQRMVNVNLTDPYEFAEFARKENIELTVVGPEAPLADGIVDLFRSKNLKIFGPTQAAAQLESSKDFAKAFMVRHGIPTAAYKTFTNVKQARAYVDKQGAPIVIKADGLAAGKGVVVAMTLEEAHAAIDMMLHKKALGKAGASIVIEEYLEGEEVSFIVMVDGKNILPLATSQDHKRLYDQDKGPNTGGMGAYSPAPVVTPALHARIVREIIAPTVAGMANEGMPYTGFLYAGLMIDTQNNTIKTLEFNCRMGDPEAQPIMARLKTDLVYIIDRAMKSQLDQVELDWDRRTALGVVMAAEGYPENPKKGASITGIPRETENCIVFHAGTALETDQLNVSGGRVLCIVGMADTTRMAQKIAYDAIEQIKFDGAQYRKDIGWRSVKQYLPPKS